MSFAPIFRATVSHGKVVFDNREALNRHLAKLEGVTVDVSIQATPETRSLEANRFYWGVIVKEMARHSGHTKEEVHEGLKHRFLRDSPDDPFARVRSTSELSVSEFSEYVERCRQLAAEYGLILSDPR